MTSRATASRARKQAILDAALDCFSTIGYERTTLADIRGRSKASTGSIYHHFESKERIAATLYLECVRETQEAGLPALLRTRSARRGIQALVSAYIDWVTAHPAKARFLLSMRHAEFVSEEDETTIEQLNADVNRQAQDWFAAHVASGELPNLDAAIRRAVVFGPCRHWAGAWLAGRTTVDPEKAKRQIGTATYAGLVALS